MDRIRFDPRTASTSNNPSHSPCFIIVEVLCELSSLYSIIINQKHRGVCLKLWVLESSSLGRV